MNETSATAAADEAATSDTNSTDELTIERRIKLRAAPGRVWNALTADSELSAWFGTGAKLEPRTGAEGWFEWEGEGRFAIRVEAVDAPWRLAWRWARDPGKPIDAGPSTLVEWKLQPDAAGAARS
jgi:uncharacterized protein YndB with AHSA1/START domain